MRFFCRFCSVKEACQYYDEKEYCYFQRTLESIDRHSFTTTEGLKEYIADKILELEYILQGSLGKNQSTHFTDMELVFRIYTLISGMLEKQIKLKSGTTEEDVIPL